MNIVVLDGHTLNPGDNPWNLVAQLGTLTVYDRTPRDQVISRALHAEIVLTNKTLLAAETLARLSQLRFVSVLATGYNVVDIEAARRHGIVVSNVPEYGTDSVAQHVFALLLEICHRVSLHDDAVHGGEWVRCPDFCFWKKTPVELAGRTMGIVGFGRIGRRVAQLALAFGMHVMATGGSEPDTAHPPSVSWSTIPEIFSTADVVSLHCPLTADNERFVNRQLLSRMKPGAVLINTARGGLIDEQALAEALDSGRPAAAAVDVVSVEPMRADNPLRAAPNCVITPHMAWGSLAARRRLMQTTAQNVEAFLSGRPIHVVS